MPGGHVLVGQPGGHVEHDDGALPVDVVPIAQAAKLLLAGRVPAEEAQLAAVGREVQRVDLHSDGGCKRKERMQQSSVVATGTANLPWYAQVDERS